MHAGGKGAEQPPFPPPHFGVFSYNTKHLSWKWQPNASTVLLRTVFNAYLGNYVLSNKYLVGLFTELCIPTAATATLVAFHTRSFVVYINGLLELGPSFVNVRCIIYRQRHCAMRFLVLGLRACQILAVSRCYFFFACSAVELFSAGFRYDARLLLL